MRDLTEWEHSEPVAAGYAEFWNALEDEDVSDFEDILRLCYEHGYADGYERGFADMQEVALVSVAMRPSDPAYWMLFDEFTTKPAIHRDGCYICEDPEFAQMGLPLCRICVKCAGHVPADDDACDDCGYIETPEDYDDTATSAIA